jgi:hypothetical protein
MDTPDTTSLNDLTAAFIALRDEKAAAASAYKVADAEIVSRMDVIKRQLLDYCDKSGVESVRTASGMFYRSVKTRYWASDWAAMHEFIQQNETFDFFEKRLAQGAVKSFLEENPDVFPTGLKVDNEYVVTVRGK